MYTCVATGKRGQHKVGVDRNRVDTEKVGNMSDAAKLQQRVQNIYMHAKVHGLCFAYLMANENENTAGSTQHDTKPPSTLTHSKQHRT